MTKRDIEFVDTKTSFSLEIDYWKSLIINYKNQEWEQISEKFDWSEISFWKIYEKSSKEYFQIRFQEELEKYIWDEKFNIKNLLQDVLWLTIKKYEKEQEFINELTSRWYFFDSLYNFWKFVLDSSNKNDKIFSIWENNYNCAIDAWSSIQEIFDSNLDIRDEDSYEEYWEDWMYEMEWLWDEIDWEISHYFNSLKNFQNWESNLEKYSEEFKEFINWILEKNEKNWKQIILFLWKWSTIWTKFIEFDAQLNNNWINLKEFTLITKSDYQQLKDSIFWEYMKKWSEWVIELMNDVKESIINLRSFIIDSLVNNINNLYY